MTPKTQTGPNYSDLARLVLERARSAREGVELIGDLIARHGYSDYGGNSHIIADADEAWVVIECAGGQKLWAAERLGPDSIRASRPGFIGEIPVAQSGHPDFRYSDNLVPFAVAQGWFDPAEDKPFNFNAVYGDGLGRWAGVNWIEGEMAKRAARPGKIRIEDIIWAIRTEKLTGDTAGYGQVVPLHNPSHPELRMLWHTQVGAIAAPFVPVFMGATDVPEEYCQHRYLTVGESSRFLDLRHGDAQASGVPQGIESTRSATLVFKRLLYLMLQHEDLFLPEITAVWVAVERRLLSAHSGVVETAATLFDAGKLDLATAFLTYYCRTELLSALDLGDTLAQSLDARTRALFGFSRSETPKSAKQIW